VTRGVHFRPIDYLVKAWPEEYCDAVPTGETMSDRAFMRRLAVRLVKSPKLTREQRATIEQRWLGIEAPELRVVGQ